MKYSKIMCALIVGALSLLAEVNATENIVYCSDHVHLDQGLDVPVRAVYKPDRHKFLRSSMARLQSGVGIQTVMLGDSIVGDTFGPQYAASGWHRGTSWGVEPLAALYKTDIYSVVEVYGSTGAWHYRLPGNVQKFVLDHLPDLVLIGGISNRGDIDALRDVVQQIRLARPETEIVLMTGAVNLQSVPASSSLLLDESVSSYEAQLARLAEEVGAGFINLRGSYDEFVIEANRRRPDIDQAYFQRDPVHANDYGRAVLRKLITMFLTSAIRCQDTESVRQRAPAPQVLNLAELVPALPAAEVAPTMILDFDIDGSGTPDHFELLRAAVGDTDQLTIVIDPKAGVSGSTKFFRLNIATGTKMLLSDINQDGRQDLVIGTSAGTAYLYVYINSGVVGHWFMDPVLLAKSTPAACTVDLATIDMNADGKPDLFAVNGCRADAGSVDYYQLDAAIQDAGMQLPEAYPTDMTIADMQVGASSTTHRAPTLQLSGTRGGKVASMVLGVSTPIASIPPESLPTPAAPSYSGGTGSLHAELMLFLAMLYAIRRQSQRRI
jgi:hypothetical protein